MPPVSLGRNGIRRMITLGAINLGVWDYGNDFTCIWMYDA